MSKRRGRGEEKQRRGTRMNATGGGEMEWGDKVVGQRMVRDITRRVKQGVRQDAGDEKREEHQGWGGKQGDVELVSIAGKSSDWAL